jgi:hypothetical protein
MTTQTKTHAEKDIDQTTQRIRDLNEQVLEFGRKAGTGFLDAYEKNLETFAGYQDKVADKVADQTKVDWVANLARAQANFTREITRVYTSTARDLIK